MQLVVVIILQLVVIITVFGMDDAGLQCYQCNRKYEYDTKCDNVTQNQIVDCHFSAVKCLTVVSRGSRLYKWATIPSWYSQTFGDPTIPDFLVTTEPYYDNQEEDEDKIMTSRRCATSEDVDWCLSINYPSILCTVCTGNLCNNKDTPIY